jgi:aryl-alcohol dehydrogenase-like predicted oxidoreductase
LHFWRQFNMACDTYHLLGRTGLRVSRLCLGAMTFGTDWGWGADEQTCRDMFARYMDWGGNFVDTADVYTLGNSEIILGKLIAERGARDRVVLATKFTHNPQPGNPNSGGNGRKNILRALDASLKRLGTDYIDLYILHCWDGVTHAEEVLRTLDDAVRAGKVRHIGLSDVPAWYAASMQTLAEVRGLEPVSSLQLEYSLIERNIEREFVPLAHAKNIGITVWSPLGFGVLTGKYQNKEKIGESQGRLASAQFRAPAKNTGTEEEDEAPALGVVRLTERNLAIVAELAAVSREVGRPMAQVAINWVATRPAVASVIIGVTKMAQLDENLQALDFIIPPEFLNRLNTASRIPPQFPYTFFSEKFNRGQTGGTTVTDKPSGYWHKRN